MSAALVTFPSHSLTALPDSRQNRSTDLIKHALARLGDVLGLHDARPHLQGGLCFRDGVTGVVFGIVFFAGAIVDNAAHDFFRVVAACKGALGIRPIALGLR